MKLGEALLLEAKLVEAISYAKSIYIRNDTPGLLIDMLGSAMKGWEKDLLRIEKALEAVKLSVEVEVKDDP